MLITICQNKPFERNTHYQGLVPGVLSLANIDHVTNTSLPYSWVLRDVIIFYNPNLTSL